MFSKFSQTSPPQNTNQDGVMSLIQNISDEEFQQEVLNAETPVLVDFWAEWCGPCRMVLPILEEIATEYKDLKIVKINISEDRQTADAYGVRGIPTLLLFQDGNLVANRVGAMTKEQLIEFIDQHLTTSE